MVNASRRHTISLAAHYRFRRALRVAWMTRKAWSISRQPPSARTTLRVLRSSPPRRTIETRLTARHMPNPTMSSVPLRRTSSATVTVTATSRRSAMRSPRDTARRTRRRSDAWSDDVDQADDLFVRRQPTAAISTLATNSATAVPPVTSAAEALQAYYGRHRYGQDYKPYPAAIAHDNSFRILDHVRERVFHV